MVSEDLATVRQYSVDKPERVDLHRTGMALGGSAVRGAIQSTAIGESESWLPDAFGRSAFLLSTIMDSACGPK